ncbi:twin-arginine translocation pathway signal protein [Roseibium alexandrii]|uniref:twin-arginine translocation pathway signal protein n=1 Tax=Roseibium alexandrii TaxID=388408 RepID=UPI0037524AAE
MKRPEQSGAGLKAGRRDFLKLAAISAPAAAAVVATGTAAQAAEPDLASEKMQDTVHTRAYYDSARF